MKLLLVCMLLVCDSQLERIVIHTKSDELAYNFFPFKSNHLEFSVKARNDVHIVLTNSFNLEMSYYEIVFGGDRNTRSEIRRDGISGPVASLNATLIDQNQFQTYWVSINETEGSIFVGMEHNKPLMFYKDPHFVKKSYFGIGTGFGSPGIWNFDNELLKCDSS